MHIIIDGYNFIRQSDRLRRFERISLEEGRKQLLRTVGEYRKLRGHKITVVFDGWGGGSLQATRDREQGVDVVYSPVGTTADEIIIAMVRRTAEEIVVVTSDRAVAAASERSGAVVLPSPEFELRITMEIEGVQEDFTAGERHDERDVSGTKKKGPSHRQSKAERERHRRLGKL